MVTRTRGAHRRYDRRLILGMRDAMGEGFEGAEIMHRAQELVDDGHYDEPAELKLRIARLESKVDRLIDLVKTDLNHRPDG